MKKILAAVLLSFWLLMATDLALAGCPSKESISGELKPLFNHPIEIISVEPGPFSGLCEVGIAVSNGPKLVIYTDESGRYVVNGQILDIKAKRNLTKERLAEFNRLATSDLKELDKFVAFTYGERGPAIYFFIDPKCPYCHKAAKVLKELADEGKLKIKVLFMPLAFHTGAKEQAISIICDNKGLEGFMANYKSNNQCPEGKKLVEGSTKLARRYGISATPTIIFPDGLTQAGFVPKDQLEGLLRKHLQQ
ncbi:DsbC family protein [Thermosulfuriphilus sp.]